MEENSWITRTIEYHIGKWLKKEIENPLDVNRSRTTSNNKKVSCLKLFCLIEINRINNHSCGLLRLMYIIKMTSIINSLFKSDIASIKTFIFTHCENMSIFLFLFLTLLKRISSHSRVHFTIRFSDFCGPICMTWKIHHIRLLIFLADCIGVDPFVTRLRLKS